MTPLSPFAVAGMQLAGTVVGLIVGGVIAWLTATRKLRSERAFDRRLEWHERMHRSLAKAQLTVNRLVWQMRDDPPLSLAASGRQLAEALGAIGDERVDAVLYADPTVIRQLADLRVVIKETLLRVNNESDRERVIAHYEEVEWQLLDALFAVAAEGRRHLGMESMTATQLSNALRVERIAGTRRED